MSVSDPILSQITPPEFGESLPASQPNQAFLDFLTQRRSLVAKDMAEPGPTPAQIDQILQLASRVPDHGRLSPWRFVLFQGAERATYGTHLAKIFQLQNPDANEKQIAFEQARLMRAPLVITVIYSPVSESKIPEWEQCLTNGAVCQNMLLAANAMGFAAQWLTEWYAFDPQALAPLKLAEHEKISGFMFIGRAQQDPTERKRPDVPSLTRSFSDL